MAQLIVVAGPPCSGKSTLAGALGLAVAAPVLDIDEIRKIVIPNSKQTQEDRNIAYRCMHLVAEKLLKAGVSRVVLAATYGRRQPRQWLSSIAERTGTQVCAIACKVSPEMAVARFRSRQPGHAAVDLTEDLVRRQAADYDYAAARVVDSTIRVEASVAQAEGYVRSGETTELADWVSHGTVSV